MKRDKRIFVIVSADEHAMLCAAAQREHRALSDYMRRAGSIIALAGEDAFPATRARLDETKPAAPEGEEES